MAHRDPFCELSTRRWYEAALDVAVPAAAALLTALVFVLAVR
jgi:hypothetical protein